MNLEPGLKLDFQSYKQIKTNIVMNLPKLYLTLPTRIYFLVINPFYILSPDTKFPFVEELKCLIFDDKLDLSFLRLILLAKYPPSNCRFELVCNSVKSLSFIFNIYIYIYI